MFIGMGDNRYEPSFGELYDKAIMYLIKFLCKIEFESKILVLNGRHLHECLIASFGIQMAGRYAYRIK